MIKPLSPIRPTIAVNKRPRPAAFSRLSPTDLEELQHFAELGRLSASLLHEISNPLTAAILELDQSSKSSGGIAQARRSLRQLRRYVEAARQQIRRQSPPISFPLRPQLEQVKHLTMPMAKGAGVELRFEAVPDCRLYGDPVKFQHILANLISNAVDAYQTDSSLSLARPVRVHLEVSTKSLLIQVIDWGVGIRAEQLPRLFEAFYSTKISNGHGLGIGLFMVKQYVSDFGGSISVTSSRRAGTRFYIKLPLT